jgi:hypothetical protein
MNFFAFDEINSLIFIGNLLISESDDWNLIKNYLTCGVLFIWAVFLMICLLSNVLLKFEFKI